MGRGGTLERGGNPSQVWVGTPSQVRVGTHLRSGEYPISGLGVPHLRYPPWPDMGWGTPPPWPDLGWGTPPQPDLGWVPPTSLARPWMEYPYLDLGWGTSPPRKCEQTENITSRHPSDVGGNEYLTIFIHSSEIQAVDSCTK